MHPCRFLANNGSVRPAKPCVYPVFFQTQKRLLVWKNIGRLDSVPRGRRAAAKHKERYVLMKMKINEEKRLRNESRLREYPALNRFVMHFIRDWQLHLLIMIPVAYMLIFHYIPMYGLQMAFRDYSATKGIAESTWVGLKWFLRFMDSTEFLGVLRNTVVLSLYTIVVSFPLPIIFALMLNAMRKEKFKKVVQQVAYMPHFISTVVLVMLVNMVCSPVSGIYGNMFRLFGGDGFPTDLRGLPETFSHMYVWSGVWQTLGWSTIIYTAALAGVSQELHEAAMIDGASRWERVLHVDLPSIMPTVCIMLIMRFGQIMSVGFEKTFLMQSELNKGVSEVISTYVYNKGMMGSMKEYSFGAAVGMFNSLINCAMLLLVNKITDWLSSGENSLF